MEVCTNCGINEPNKGRKWCQSCFETSLCANCKKNPKNKGRKWCQSCFEATRAPANLPRSSSVVSSPIQTVVNTLPGLTLIPLNSKNEKYISIQKQFTEGMLKKSYTPVLKAIFSVNDKERFKKFEDYKEIVSAENYGDANERRWWHGTMLGCPLNDNATVCSGNCHVCSILQKGFLLKYANSTRSWGRFGNGLYFACDAAKSNDYTTPNKDGIRCLVLCKLIVGKPMIYTQDQTALQAPPTGYHSVLGEKGSSLNFPELVMWNEDGILPAYAVFYTCPLPV